MLGSQVSRHYSPSLAAVHRNTHRHWRQEGVPKFTQSHWKQVGNAQWHRTGSRLGAHWSGLQMSLWVLVTRRQPGTHRESRMCRKAGSWLRCTRKSGAKGMLKCSEDIRGTKIRVPGTGGHGRWAAWHWKTFVESLETWGVRLLVHGCDVQTQSNTCIGPWGLLLTINWIRRQRILMCSQSETSSTLASPGNLC